MEDICRRNPPEIPVGDVCRIPPKEISVGDLCRKRL